MAATRQSSRTPDAQAAGDTRNGAEEAAVRRLSIDTIRALAMDAVQKANAGHPGTAMALAPLAYTIFERFLRANPNDPAWPDRDRFILSSGHACMLQYAVLHLTGYDLGVSDLEEFRQWGSRTPGHPERGDTPGIEVTTGPLGQGISNSVGFAMAERFLAERFNRPGNEIVDHHTYVICSDGDMMEGVSQEAASIAGHFALGKLIVCYDDNHITIDGTTAISFDGENHGARMEADGWHTQRVEDSEDVDAIEARSGRARGTGAPVVHLDPLAHRLPRAESDRHGEVARRRARRGGSAAYEGSDGLRPRPPLLGRRERLRAHVAGRRGRRRAGALDGALPRLARGLPRHGGRLGPCLVGPAARRLARVAADVRRRRKARDARRRPEDDGRLRRVRADDDRRRRRPRRVDQDPVRGRRGVLEGARRPQHPLRHPRARDGRDRQRRRRARRHRQAVRLDVPACSPTTCAARCGCRR